MCITTSLLQIQFAESKGFMLPLPTSLCTASELDAYRQVFRDVGDSDIDSIAQVSKQRRYAVALMPAWMAVARHGPCLDVWLLSVPTQRQQSSIPV
jgi:hypothetical protein